MEVKYGEEIGAALIRESIKFFFVRKGPINHLALFLHFFTAEKDKNVTQMMR